jgi:hypothetical protein
VRRGSKTAEGKHACNQHGYDDTNLATIVATAAAIAVAIAP